MARKKPAAATGAQAPAATAEQQGNLPAASTTIAAPAAVAAAPGSIDAAGSTEQTTQAPGADAALTVVDPAASTTGQDAQPPAGSPEQNIDLSQAGAAELELAAGTAAAPGDTAGNSVDDSADTSLEDGDVEGLWITAVPEQGFRRCGFRFTREGTAIALTALTELQLQQLESEPNLKVARGVFSGLEE